MAEPKEVDVQVFSPSGAALHSFSFDGGSGNGASAVDATSSDQRHVYVAMAVADNYVADIDTQTYGVRYYRIPLRESDGEILAILVNPDGSRLYVPTTENLYVVNTLTRTYAGTFKGQLTSTALSPDGKTLYGVMSGQLTAVDTATLRRRGFASDPGAQAMAATTTDLYVGTTNGVRVYNAATLTLTRTILSSLVQRLVADPVERRLYAWIDGATSQYGVIVNTATQSTIKTLPNVFQGPFLDPVSHLIYTIDLSGNVCSFAPPSYSRSCSFTANSSVPFDIAATH